MNHHHVKAIVKQKFRIEENIITALDAYQIVGAEYQNRLLVIVNNHDTYALFAFAVHNNPITTITDVTVLDLWEINNEFRIEECMTSGVSSYKFKIYINDNSQTYYYYPDEATIASKNIFQHFVHQIVSQYCSDMNCFKWLDPYRTDGPDSTAVAMMAALKTRGSICRNELGRRREEYTKYKDITIYVATWNVNSAVPGDISLREWLANSETAPDIYAIGFQEIDMSAQDILTNEQKPDRVWVDKILGGLHPDGRYMELKTLRLVGLMLTVLIKTNLRTSVKSCTFDMVGTGIVGRGNKGGLGISLTLDEASICFVNSHLAAHLAEVERRNEDHNEIIRRMQFKDEIEHKSIDSHQHIFWMGDLNYRIELHKDEIKKLKDYKNLYEHDQLFIEKMHNRIFKDYVEPPISFPPTYRYNVGTDDWDSSEKARAPAFCDRILYKGQRIESKKYDCVMTLRQSDHKALYGVFNVQLQKRDEEQFKRVIKEVVEFVEGIRSDNHPMISVEEAIQVNEL